MIDAEGRIKMIDFGLAKQAKSKKKSMDTVVGTPYYVAPEVLEGHYTNECDLWSAGVIMYILMCGYLPFSGDNARDVFDKILAGKFSMT
jgi:calcium-dependent protein kinase